MTNSIDSCVDGSLHRLTERRGDAVSGEPRSRPAPKQSDSSADLLDLTGRAQSLKALEQELADTPAFDAKRVAELKESVSSGRYQVDAQRVAEKLLAMESKLP